MTDHDGCVGFKYELESGERYPCSVCKQNYTDKWEPMGHIKRYKTKPCEIEAIQWDGSNVEEIKNFIGEYFKAKTIEGIYIRTLEGVMRARVGDYIIKGLRGEFYPCKPDVFEKKYELI